MTLKSLLVIYILKNISEKVYFRTRIQECILSDFGILNPDLNNFKSVKI